MPQLSWCVWSGTACHGSPVIPSQRHKVRQPSYNDDAIKDVGTNMTTTCAFFSINWHRYVFGEDPALQQSFLRCTLSLTSWPHHTVTPTPSQQEADLMLGRNYMSLLSQLLVAALLHVMSHVPDGRILPSSAALRLDMRFETLQWTYGSDHGFRSSKANGSRNSA